MSFKQNMAKYSAGASRFALKKVLHRDGGFFPGKIALKIDENLLVDMAKKFDKGTVLVTGTNGKTSTTSLIADCARHSGANVCTNSTGANLSSGLASAMLEFNPARRRNCFGVFEIDELWVADALPKMRSKLLLLLNLFPDQVDRFGDISNIQKSLIGALKQSPDTCLIYNADDPNCQQIADACPNKTISFGALEKISNNDAASINKCPECGFDLNYKIQQYAQLGQYRCPNCGFNRAGLKFGAKNINLTAEKLEFDILDDHFSTTKAAEYVCYNLIGFIATAKTLNCDYDSIDFAIKNHKTQNGRMQKFEIGDANVMINLAKNPVGFNQNIEYIINHLKADNNATSTSVAFFVNAREGDGRSTN